MKYRVEIVERLSRIVKVEAENELDALDKVYESYYNEEIVLNSDDFWDVEANIIR